VDQYAERIAVSAAHVIGYILQSRLHIVRCEHIAPHGDVNVAVGIHVSSDNAAEQVGCLDQWSLRGDLPGEEAEQILHEQALLFDDPANTWYQDVLLIEAVLIASRRPAQRNQALPTHQGKDLRRSRMGDACPSRDLPGAHAETLGEFGEGPEHSDRAHAPKQIVKRPVETHVEIYLTKR
jgi:hypothetical protein